MDFAIGILFGFILCLVIVLPGVMWLVDRQKAEKAAKAGKRLVPLLLLSLFVFSLGAAGVAFAQDPTLVPLEIPINPIMTSTNSWMATFAPIAAIGIGITLAIAVLAYIGKMIKSAFH